MSNFGSSSAEQNKQVSTEGFEWNLKIIISEVACSKRLENIIIVCVCVCSVTVTCFRISISISV